MKYEIVVENQTSESDSVKMKNMTTVEDRILSFRKAGQSVVGLQEFQSWNYCSSVHLSLKGSPGNIAFSFFAIS